VEVCVHRDRDRGQALGLVLIAVGMVAVIAVALAHVGTRLVARSRAQNAADAAALAGVEGGAVAAAAMADHNGGALVSFVEHGGPDGSTVTVEVTVGGERAVAAASTEP
jgi:Flp pilus assembly protein TadG